MPAAMQLSLANLKDNVFMVPPELKHVCLLSMRRSWDSRLGKFNVHFLSAAQ